MKRVIVRVVALTAVVVIGLGAITQAQRVLRARSPETPPTQAEIEAAKRAAASTQLAGNNSFDDNPFAGAGGRTTAEASQSDQYGDWSSQPGADETRAQPPYTERQALEDRSELAGSADATETEQSGGRVQPVVYDEPVVLEPVPDDAAQAAPQEPTLADPIEEPAMSPGDQQQSSSVVEEHLDATPVADENGSRLPAEEPSTSQRRTGRAAAESARLDPRDRLAPAPADSGVEPTADNFRRSQSDADMAPAEVGAVQGSGRPGDPGLEGRQSHALELEKRFPADAQVGMPVAIDITVRNAGEAVAKSLEIVDAVPQGARLVATRPQAEVGPQGTVRWAIAALPPGEETTVSLEVVPLTEGELGSVASVHFTAEASARAKVTRPAVSLSIAGPGQVLIGQDVPLVVKVANNGSGIARALLLREEIPEGLSHPAGGELEYEVGDLAAGEVREVQLTLKAERAGQYANAITARGEGEAHAEATSQVEVVAPALAVDLAGGMRRYLERPAKFTLSVTNEGTAAARQLELEAQLPSGMEFVEATNYGQYDQQSHTIRWSLEELPARQAGSVELTLRPIAEGEQKIVLRGSAEPLAKVEKELVVAVEGIATTLFEVVDVEDPIEKNAETSYEIRVVNQGTKAATNVQVVAVLPDGLEAIEADGPARYQIDGQRVLFDPVERLAPKADTSYRVRVKALSAGEMRVQVQLLTDEMRSPVTEEESTRVYSNE